jgi:hypothetical protein
MKIAKNILLIVGIVTILPALSVAGEFGGDDYPDRMLGYGGDQIERAGQDRRVYLPRYSDDAYGHFPKRNNSRLYGDYSLYGDAAQGDARYYNTNDDRNNCRFVSTRVIDNGGAYIETRMLCYDDNGHSYIAPERYYDIQ